MPKNSKNTHKKVNSSNSIISPKLGADEKKATIAHPLGTPGTSRQLQPGKRVRSREEMEANKKDRKNESVEVRNGVAYYDTSEEMAPQNIVKEKNEKAISGACVENDDEDQMSFNPKETSTDSETESEETVSEVEYPVRGQTEKENLTAMANSMALAFQTEAVKKSLRRVFDPHFERLNKSFDDYKKATNERIQKLEEQVDQIAPLERKVNELQTIIEDNLQEVCNLNLVITGLDDDSNLRDQCLTIASEQMAIDPYKVNIIDVKKLPPRRNGQGPPRYKIRFDDITSRTMFFKGRTNKECKIWINEDLCAPRSKLAYQARLVVTAGLRKRTWTYLGKVFTLQDDNSRPRLVNRYEELPPLPTPAASS